MALAYEITGLHVSSTPIPLRSGDEIHFQLNRREPISSATVVMHRLDDEGKLAEVVNGLTTVPVVDTVAGTATVTVTGGVQNTAYTMILTTVYPDGEERSAAQTFLVEL